MSNSVASGIFSINDIIATDTIYNIPRYQRLYVWTNDQVTTLLEDIQHACFTERPLFYLGGVLIVRTSDTLPHFDLIDGQQRFTTLWLLCLTLGLELSGFLEVEEKSRLTFSIREDVTRYFDAIRKNKEFKGKLNGQLEAGSLTKIIYAKNLIRGFVATEFKDQPERLEQFRNYIRYQVKVIISTVPVKTNLNKLFEVINNRGLQLQHHEILKSFILSKITSDKKVRIRYGKIWNACADMTDYIERNLYYEAGRSVVEFYNLHSGKFDFTGLLKIMDGKDTVASPMTLSAIIESRPPKNSEFKTPRELEEHPETKDDEYEIVRSILTFPQLLQHTLRIYLFRSGKKDIPQIIEKDLLVSFAAFLKDLTEKEALAFIELLFEIKVRFDKHVIKWVTTSPNTETHLIKPLQKQRKKAYSQTFYFRREKPSGSDAFTLLQSMLYHSQQKTTLHWLTPFLYKMLSTENRDELLIYLQKLDNAMFCTKDPDELMKRSWKYLGKEVKIAPEAINLEDLKNSDGTGFWHYWFYKLEYVLWFMERQLHPDWRNFRMTSKNSIEHVSPQSQKRQDFNTVSMACLNTFGNLALVTRNINSEYGHNEYNVKQRKFLNNKKDNRLDSLKLDLIYASEDWNDDLCNAHNLKMQQVMKDYVEKYT